MSGVDQDCRSRSLEPIFLGETVNGENRPTPVIARSAATRQSHSVSNLWIKVPPIRIGLFNQIDFRFPGTCLDLLFSCNGLVHVFGKLEVNQPCQVVSGGESLRCLVPVLPYSFGKVAGDPSIQGAIWLVGQQIYGRLPFHHVLLYVYQNTPCAVESSGDCHVAALLAMT